MDRSPVNQRHADPDLHGETRKANSKSTVVKESVKYSWLFTPSRRSKQHSLPKIVLASRKETGN